MRQCKPIPLWRQMKAAKLAASPAPAPPPTPQPPPRRPRLRPGRVDEALAVMAPVGCVWEHCPDSGLSGWVYG